MNVRDRVRWGEVCGGMGMGVFWRKGRVPLAPRKTNSVTSQLRFQTAGVVGASASAT